MISIVFCVLCLQLAWGYALPGSSGVGAYSISDSSGRRFGGTYDLRDGQVVGTSGDFPPPGGFPTVGSFPSVGDFPVPFADAYRGYGYGYPEDNFFPAYFTNLDGFLHDIRLPRAFLPPLPPLPPVVPFRPFKPFRTLSLNRRAFDSNYENQKLAFNAARKAFDLTSNQVYIPNFAYRLQPFNNLPGFGDFRSMPNIPNSAFASTAAGPGFRHQVAAINPENPHMPNINKFKQFSETPGRDGFFGVSSKTSVSSSNVNGQELTSRRAETIINDNGKITKYEAKN